MGSLPASVVESFSQQDPRIILPTYETRACDRLVEFPYIEITPGHFSPIIRFYLLAQDRRWIEIEGYVDSGATVSLFDTDAAKILGLKIRRGKGISITVGNGEALPAYMHEVRARLGNTAFSVPVGFSHALGVGFNLIGRAGFFDRFRICFDDRRRIVSFTPLK